MGLYQHPYMRRIIHSHEYTTTAGSRNMLTFRQRTASTSWPWRDRAGLEFIKELGRRVTVATGDQWRSYLLCMLLNARGPSTAVTGEPTHNGSTAAVCRAWLEYRI